MGQTVNLLSLDFGGSNPSSPTKQGVLMGAYFCGWRWIREDGPFFISLRESVPFGHLAALRVRILAPSIRSPQYITPPDIPFKINM